MKPVIVATLAAALTVGSASVALPQAGSGSNVQRSESARAADRNDNFDWGWLGLLGLGGLAGLMGRDRRRAGVHDYSTTSTADRTTTGTGTTTSRGF
jgi:hypothetical protein